MPRHDFRFVTRRLALAALFGLIIIPIAFAASTRKTTGSRKSASSSSTRTTSSGKKSATKKKSSTTTAKASKSTPSKTTASKSKSSSTRSKAVASQSTQTNSRKSSAIAKASTELAPPRLVKAPSASGDATEVMVSAATIAPRGMTPLDRVAPFRRCLWVSRWEYESEQDIVKICYNAASARFTDIFFQVRGAGSVAFRSSLEPWAPQLAGAIGRSPGYDPLATAIREAHKYGLRVHAYMNALPGASPGETNTPLYINHREWFMVDSSGRTMTPTGLYAFLDPGLPEVRDYLARLYAEVATRYPVDGIHLDYIRYPEEKGDFSYHPEVVAEFRRTYGTTPYASPASWAQFRRAQVTKAVAAIAAAARRARPGIEVSASVIADTDKGYNRAFQPGLDWVRSGVLDAIAPMAYSGDVERFEMLCAPYRDAAVRGKVWMGVWADPGRNQNLVEEVRRAISMKFGAVSVFSYGEIFSAHRATPRAAGVYNAFVQQQTRISMAE